MSNNNEIGLRIKEIRKTLKLTQADFAKGIGSTQNNLTCYETGRRNPSAAVLHSICREYDVNRDYLEKGIGDMFNPMSEDEELDLYIGRISGSNSKTDISKKKLIKAICKLSDDEWEVLKKIIAEMQEG